MKRTLQWKFIRTAMMAVTVLLLVLLGAINLLNWWQVERQTDWMLQVLTQGDAPPVAVSYTHLDVYKRQHQ